MDGRIETNEPNTAIAAERFSNTPRASTILRDIGELKRVHQRLQLLAAVTSELIASDQPQQIIDGLCRKVMEHLDCQVFFNYLVDEEEHRLRLNAHAGVSEETARQIQWLDSGPRSLAARRWKAAASWPNTSSRPSIPAPIWFVLWAFRPMPATRC